MSENNIRSIKELETVDLERIYKNAVFELHNEETGTYNEYIVKKAWIDGVKKREDIVEDAFSNAHVFFTHLDGDVNPDEKKKLVELRDRMLNDIVDKGINNLEAVYSLALSIPVAIAYVRYINNEATLYLEFARSKWEYRGDYPFMDPDYDHESDLHKWLYFYFSKRALEGEVGWRQSDDFIPNYKWKQPLKSKLKKVYIDPDPYFSSNSFEELSSSDFFDEIDSVGIAQKKILFCGLDNNYTGIKEYLLDHNITIVKTFKGKPDCIVIRKAGISQKDLLAAVDYKKQNQGVKVFDYNQFVRLLEDVDLSKTEKKEGDATIVFKDKIFVPFVDYDLRGSIPASIIRRGGLVRGNVSGKTDYIVYDSYGAYKVSGNDKAKIIKLEEYNNIVKTIPIIEPPLDYGKNIFSPCEGQDMNEYCLTYRDNIELCISNACDYLATVRALIAVAANSELERKYKSVIVSELCSDFFSEYLSKKSKPANISEVVKGMPNYYGEIKESKKWIYRDLFRPALHLSITDSYIYEEYLKDATIDDKALRVIKNYSYDLSLVIDNLLSVNDIKSANSTKTDIINSYLCNLSGITPEQLQVLQFRAHPSVATEDFVFYENQNGELILMRYIGNQKNVVIPETVDGKTVTAIFSFAFANKWHLNPDWMTTPTSKMVQRLDTNNNDTNTIQNIEIPNTVREIGEYAFKELKGLESICIPEGVSIIPSFAGCSSVNSIKLPNHVFSIRATPFFNCDSLKDITLPPEISRQRKLFSDNMIIEAHYSK